MVITHQQLKRVIATGALVLCAHAFIVVAQASTVPSDWNVTPAADGVYREGFEASTHTNWVTGDSVVTNANFPTMVGAGFPERSNTWFTGHAKVLKLDTKGEFLTNPLTNSSNQEVSFETKPVYVDMRVFFGALEGTPSEDSFADSKLAIYATPKAGELGPYLVVVHNDGFTTNTASALDTNKWHQITVKLASNTFDVVHNDAAVVAFTGLTPKDNEATNVLQSIDFYGTVGDTVSGGYIDELYVSHGSPARTTTSVVPDLPSGTGPTETEKELLRQWVSVHPNMNGAVSAFTGNLTHLGHSYLLDQLTVSGTNITATTYVFGVSKIELLSTTSIEVTLKLTVDGSPKAGDINGKVQMQGKATQAAEWADIGSLITPTFTTGLSEVHTVNFAEGPKFFRARIVQ